MSESLVRADGLTRVLGAWPVLTGIDLALSPGRSLAVMGANGAGKSTLLRVLAGLLNPSSGQLWRLGKRVQLGDEPDPQVGLLGHQSFLYGHLHLWENLVFYARLYRRGNPARVAEEAMDRVGLRLVANEPVGTFSRGMIQRAALARLLVTGTRLWLLDEPFTGLDEDGRQVMVGVVQQAMTAGIGVILTTHRMDEALSLGDALAILQSGRFVWWGLKHPECQPEWELALGRFLDGKRRHA